MNDEWRRNAFLGSNAKIDFSCSSIGIKGWSLGAKNYIIYWITDNLYYHYFKVKTLFTLSIHWSQSFCAQLWKVKSKMKQNAFKLIVSTGSKRSRIYKQNVGGWWVGVDWCANRCVPGDIERDLINNGIGIKVKRMKNKKKKSFQCEYKMERVERKVYLTKKRLNVINTIVVFYNKCHLDKVNPSVSEGSPGVSNRLLTRIQ